MSCGGGSFTRGCLRFCLGQCEADDWKFPFISSSRGRWVFLRAECLVQQQRHYLRRQLHLLPVQVAGMCRNEKWELYLYGDLSFKVDRVSVEVLPRGLPPLWFFTLLGNGSHYLRVVPTFRAWPGDEHAFGSSSLEREVLRDVRVHSFFCGPPAMSFTVSLAGCTIAATAAAVSTSSASADCTGSATPMCSSGAYAAMSCDGGSLTPVGAVHGLTG